PAAEESGHGLPGFCSCQRVDSSQTLLSDYPFDTSVGQAPILSPGADPMLAGFELEDALLLFWRPLFVGAEHGARREALCGVRQTTSKNGVLPLPSWVEGQNT